MTTKLLGPGESRRIELDLVVLLKKRKYNICVGGTISHILIEVMGDILLVAMNLAFGGKIDRASPICTVADIPT